MNSQAILGSLAMDLKRVAVGYYRGSDAMARRFCDEALARKKEVQSVSLKPYVKRLLEDLDDVLSQKDIQKLAEDALMYSTLFQNAALNNK